MLRPILVALLFTFSLPAQQEEDVDIAFARSSPTWTVVEKSGGSRWDATWTLRPDGKSFDAHWKQTPGGAQGDLRNFARIISMAGARIVIERPGLGRYTGTFSADRQRILDRFAQCTRRPNIGRHANPSPGRQHMARC
jgi:hypothetical protein